MEEVQVERAAGGGDDDELMMDCNEDELEAEPQSPQGDQEEEEEEEHNEAVESAVSPMEEEQTDSGSVRIVPLPVQPVSNFSATKLNNAHNNTAKGSAAPLGFKVNGWLVSLLPGGAGVQLQLRSHPGGSASGFTTVQIPITVTVHSPAGTHLVNTSLTTSSTTAPPPPPPPAAPVPPPAAPEPDDDPTPIITGVVSGEAAQKVLNNHSVNFTSSPLLTGTKTPSTGASPLIITVPQTLTSVQTTPPASQTTKPKPSRSKRPVAPPKPLHKVQLGPVSPPDCLICNSQYKLIMQLRGFMCLCSPLIAQSLKNLKKKKKNRRRSKDKIKTSKPSKDSQSSSKVSKTRPGPGAGAASPAAYKVVSPVQRIHRPSNAPRPTQFTRPAPPSSTSTPQQNQCDPQRGKLVIMVEDFYYGSAPGQSTKNNPKDRKFNGPYRCIHCPKTLRNNIKLMSHMQQHVSSMSQEDGCRDAESSCPHCFRHFFSPFKLQCHLEAVHSQYESTAKCKICELEFGSEPDFLWHMKITHKPGEMPYVCQVCDFRSSFYSDVWSHFEQVHADTNNLMCQYCLRVLRTNACYQQHFARHQRKHRFSCDKCRLHFLYVKERIEHKLEHRTHIRPPQLIGLKPGTKVTVRTYSVVGGSDSEEGPKIIAPCKVVDVEPPPPTQEVPRRKPAESLGSLLSNLNQDSETVGVSQPSQRCVECLSSLQDFVSHFPSLVHCSLCRFITCCSTSYANHMINNHSSCSKKPQYHLMFTPGQRLLEGLKCVSCSFSTHRGDVMANHLAERPGHDCIMLTHNELSVNGAETKNTADGSYRVTSFDGQRGGAFVPIHLLSSGQTSPQLSVKALTSPSPLSSPPAMTIKFLGPRPQPEQPPVYGVSPLTASQLSVVLFSLCHGVPQASRRFQVSPQTIRSWIALQRRQLSDRKWCWKTEKVGEWLLSQREQQLSVSEDDLLQTARRALGDDSQLIDRYSWTVDFLLRHQLSVQPTDTDGNRHHRGRLPKNITDNSRAFIHSLTAQIDSRRVLPHAVASMDEFSIFIDLDRFSDQDPSALRLSGSSEDRPVFDVVLSALSDGTFLPPLLFFRGTPSQVPEGFPSNVLLEARQDGYSDQDRLRIWIDKVWRPRVASRCHSASVLMVDVHRGHLSDEFRGSLSSLSTDVVFIPSGCCCRLQPLDVCVTPVLRHFLQVRWSQLVSQGGLDGLGLDQLALTLACWLSEVSSTLNSETHTLCRSFVAVCNLQQVEDREEAARMIHDLTEILVQPLETSEPPEPPEPPEPAEPAQESELELLLVMEEEEKEEQQQQEEEEQELVLKSPSALRRVFDGESDQETFYGFHDD